MACPGAALCRAADRSLLLLLSNTTRAHTPDPQARESQSPWTEVWPTQPVLTQPRKHRPLIGGAWGKTEAFAATRPTDHLPATPPHSRRGVRGWRSLSFRNSISSISSHQAILVCRWRSASDFFSSPRRRKALQRSPFRLRAPQRMGLCGAIRRFRSLGCPAVRILHRSCGPSGHDALTRFVR